MKDVLDKQSQHLDNLDKSAKRDTLIQLMQLREELKTQLWEYMEGAAQFMVNQPDPTEGDSLPIA